MSSSMSCAMRASCGSDFGRPLPCPYDGPPVEPDDDARALLVKVCGNAYAEGPTCCDNDQVKAMRDNFGMALNLISTCPACANNFRDFFCSFTCSPDQRSFVNVTAVQTSSDNQKAVKSVDFFVEPHFASGFYDSCKNVQYGAANGFAMDLLGGGAKNYSAFLKFLGDKKILGSPFQIDYPPAESTPPEYTPLNITPRNCGDTDLTSRCPCIDCPDVCPTLPPIDLPGSGPFCHVGVLSCLSFVLIVAYGLACAGLLLGFLGRRALARRREQTYERVALAEGDTSSIMSPRTHSHGLVGTTSLAQGHPYPYTDEDSSGLQSETRRLGRGASLLDPVTTVQPRHYPLHSFLRRAFYRLGLWVAMSPWLTFATVFLLFGLLNIGWNRFSVETDPVRLWVAPDSESKQQKDFFDQNFGPFYRTEQIFVTATTSDGSSESEQPVLSWETLLYWEKVETHIRTLQSPEGHSLSDVCFKPAGPRGACVVQSALAWFGNDLDDYGPNTWAQRLTDCVRSPVECLPDFQQPLGPQFVLGGVPNDENGSKIYTDAIALVITYVIQASLDPEVEARAMAWETALQQYLFSLSQVAPHEAKLNVAFSTGISLEEELNKSTNMDIRIVILSYLAMFFYVALTLGSNSVSSRDEDSVFSAVLLWMRNFPKLFSSSHVASSNLSVDSRAEPTILPRLPRGIFTGSKFALGLFGIALVILSVSSTVGFFSFMGVKVTLIIAEVIPFLVLAVGVDNVYILVHELDRQNALHGSRAPLSFNNSNLPSGGPPSSASGRAFTAPMSPTNSHRSPFESTHDDVDSASVPVFLSAEERVARTLGKMGPSILLSSLTETIAFALGALVPMPAVRNFALYAAGSVLLNAILQVTVFISAMLLDLKRIEASRVDCFPCIRLPPRIALAEEPTGSSLSSLAKFIRHYYAPFLLRPFVKGVILILFAGVFVASVVSMQHIQIGLDQRLALPSDSYLISYFNHLDAYLDVGPPVYFVSRDLDVTRRPGQQALCGRFTTCQEKSLANVLEAERKRNEVSFISEPAASWIDDFLGWLDPIKESCCRVRKADPSVFCEPQEPDFRCHPCYKDKQPPWNITMVGLPEDSDFMRYLRQWLNSPTSEDCPLAGKASYGTALSLNNDSVFASHFRTMHSPLKSQDDFINAFAASHRIADDISRETGSTVFPYSLFYVFFDQYAHIVAITQEILGLGLASVLVVTALMLGSWRTGTIVTSVIALTVLAVMGMMVPSGISLNAISLVNLVISLGIAVEFCAHIARAFMNAGSGLPVDHPAGQRERDERMFSALVDVGPSVISGITTTKLIGMSVLALTRSKLLEIYYFRMWLSLIIAGAAHGLVLLPVILSLAGGPGFPLQEVDEEWMSNAIRNDYEYAPFLTDNDSVASD